ncbi:DUF2161 domain-containing protein [Marinicrinis lubricantis]|uniref:DUF2161 family putative PD-(D/E)XK-type phosphodiesterase n=2 Tax=Marinicrinis lubricantis TaxID=2086470 RepID=A0ABW1IPZ2_9BACL
MRETDLYVPVKEYLEFIGYEVKAEVMDCDAVAYRSDLEHPIILELKLQFNLSVVLQAVDRLSMSPTVYIVIPSDCGPIKTRSKKRAVVRLCRMLGIGLISVSLLKRGGGLVDIICEPEPYQFPLQERKSAKLMKEFQGRVGDFNQGGSTRTKRMTAYRQKALLLAALLEEHGMSSPAQLKAISGIVNAGILLRQNVYGWFERIAKGQYTLSPAGIKALQEYSEVVAKIKSSSPEKN